MTTATCSQHYLAWANAFMVWFVIITMTLYGCCCSNNNGYKNHVATAFAPIVSMQHYKTLNPNIYTGKQYFKVKLDKVPNTNESKSTELFFFRRIFGMNKQGNKHDDDDDDDNNNEEVVANKRNEKGENVNILSTDEEKQTVPKSETNEKAQDTGSKNDEKSSKDGPMFFARLVDWRKKDDVVVSPTKVKDTATPTIDSIDSSLSTVVPGSTQPLEKLESTNSSKSIPENESDGSFESELTSKAMPEPTPKKEMSPQEKAEALRAQAERARLEAEKMDVLLTIEKIEKLQKELGSKAVSNDPKRVQDVQNQITSLKKKLVGNGQTSGDTLVDSDTSTVVGGETVNGGQTSSKEQKGGSTDGIISKDDKRDLDAVLSSVVSETRREKTLFNPSLSMDDNLKLKVKRFQEAPPFMQEIVTKSLGMEMSSDLNVTDVVLKLYKDDNGPNDGATFDVSLRNDKEQESVPEFTQEQIDEVLQAVQLLPKFIKNMYGDDVRNNDTAIALMLLEEEWRSGNLVVMPEITQQMIDEKLEEIKWIPQYLRGENSTELAIELIKSDFRRNKGKQQSKNDDKLPSEMQQSQQISGEDTESQDQKNSGFSLFGGQQKSDKDQMVESLFPESTRKKEEEINEGQAILFMSEVLAKDNVWVASGPPEKVSGGFLIRGSTRFESGKELIEAIDKNLSKSRVRNQVNCFYIFDPTPVTEEQMSSGERPPLLFLTAPNVARDPAPIQRSLISAVTFGTIWYNSLLPFLLNDKYLKLTEEQMALADASMPSNVDFLNDLSFPLFATTVGIQAIHELSHIIAARNNNLNITIPTLVPSLGTGLLGGITSLKTPPRDKQSLFDFAISGPLAGMGISVILLAIGMVATISMDVTSYENLPALPFNLLRQSSLAGGIINSISPGLLTVPDAALGSKALSEINIPLHPFAIAGYFGLMINAVNLLPVGRTDGGRIALTLFGRSGAQLVSFLTFVGMFIQGILGSDLILFFFSFVVFFQSELEIPQRNEVDDMDFSRVLLATATGVLVLLTLIPM